MSAPATERMTPEGVIHPLAVYELLFDSASSSEVLFSSFSSISTRKKRQIGAFNTRGQSAAATVNLGLSPPIHKTFMAEISVRVAYQHMIKYCTLTSTRGLGEDSSF